MTSMRTLGVAAGIMATTAACTTLACDVTVIFSEAPGHPTAIVPGAVGLDGKPIVTEFKAMEILTVSPNGNRWVIKARSHGGSDVETMIVEGTFDTGAVLMQEGQPIPGGAAGEVFDFFGTGGADFGTSLHFVVTARARGGDSAIAQKGFFCNHDNECTLVREQGDPALGLTDLPPNPSGDELFGNSFGSFHLVEPGLIGSQDPTIQNIHSSRRPAVFYGDNAFLQAGVSPIGNNTWEHFDLNGFSTTRDGSTFLVIGRDDGPASQDGIVVVGSATAGAGGGIGTVVLREGTEIGESGVVIDGVFQTRLVDDGSWFARGDDADNDDWAVRNGVVIAKTGDPIVPGSDEHWGDAIVAVNGNNDGHWVISGKTDSADPATDSVIVWKGFGDPIVVLREGDPVDLDGNGEFDDDAFVGQGDPDGAALHANDLFITPAFDIYTFVSLRNAAGEDLGSFGSGGDAFIRISPFDAGCPGDVDGCGSVDVQDLTTVILEWGPCPPGPCPADITGDGMVGVDDLIIVILNWGGC
jgi:hypothetical protein